MQYSFLDLLSSALVPILCADITTGTASNVHLVLVSVVAVRAIPNELSVLFNDLYLSVISANLAIIALCVELRVDDVIIDKLENTLKNMKPITELLDSDMTPEMILEEVLGEFELQINDKIETSYYCNCSKDRVHKAISSIPKKDIQDMINDNKPIEVDCHFCEEKYVFEVDELKEMIANR